jgi:phosphohistidine phosphatase SixA
MRRLIIVRHGDYGEDYHLSQYGIEQITLLSTMLKATTNGESIAILSSVATRAVDSAKILGKAFGVPFEEHDVLWSENRHPENLQEALELVRSKKDCADVLVLVTHLEYVYLFPNHFGKEELGVTSFPRREIGKGTAWDIDCEAKTISWVS